MYKNLSFNGVTQKSDLKIFTNVIDLPTEDCGIAHSIARFANVHIGNDKIQRRTPILITNTRNNRTTVRYAMGNGGTVKGLNKNTIAIDYDAIIDLGVQFKQPVIISVKKATIIQCLRWLANSPDLNIKLNTRLALLGAGLGLLGLLISLL